MKLIMTKAAGAVVHLACLSVLGKGPLRPRPGAASAFDWLPLVFWGIAIALLLGCGVLYGLDTSFIVRMALRVLFYWLSAFALAWGISRYLLTHIMGWYAVPLAVLLLFLAHGLLVRVFLMLVRKEI